MRVVLRAILFLVLAAALFVYLNLAFVTKGTNQSKGAFEAFYDLPADTVDVMYLGTSATSRYFVNPKAYNDYGIASFSIAPPNSPAYFIKHLIDEVELTQHPRLYVIELRVARRDPREIGDGFVRTTLDTMNLVSPNRVAMSREAMEYCEDGSDNLFDYLVPIAKYHSRLLAGDLTERDFLLRTPNNRMQGFHASRLSLSQTPQERPTFSTGASDLDKTAEEVLWDLLDYCSTLDAQVLFVLAPCAASEGMSKELNAVDRFVSARGFDVLNCNNYEACDAMGLDWSADFYNNHHVNYLGAEKYTDYLGAYLKQHYDLPDRRGDSAYRSWDDGYAAYVQYVAQGIRYHDSGDEGED